MTEKDLNDVTVDFTIVAFLTSIPLSSAKYTAEELNRNIPSSLSGKEL